MDRILGNGPIQVTTNLDRIGKAAVASRLQCTDRVAAMKQHSGSFD